MPTYDQDLDLIQLRSKKANFSFDYNNYPNYVNQSSYEYPNNNFSFFIEFVLDDFQIEKEMPSDLEPTEFAFLVNFNKVINKSILSSNFVASLELAKNGFIDVKQNIAFGNIFVKLRKS